MLQLEFGGQKYPIPAPEAVVGSEPGLAITLAGAGIQPRHAVLQSAADGSVSVRALGAGAELSLNGVKVGTDPHPILHGDKIKVGSHELLVVDPQRSGSTQYVSASDLANAVASIKKGGAAKPTAGLVNGRLVCLTDGREYAINRASLIMGRDASCDVVVESKNVSRKHAEIVTSPNGYLLIDHSTNGTLVNGEKIQGQRLLARSDMIRVGEDDFRFYADQPPGGGQPAPPQPAAAPAAAPPPAAPAAQQPSAPPPGARQRLHDTMHGAPPAAAAAPAPGPLASLLIRSGARKGERVAIRVPVVNIGRADYNDVVLAEESVSTQHAKLQRREGVWMLVDLGSTNGSFVDGERVEGEAPVTPGATLRFGDASVIFDPKDEGVEVAKGGSTKMISAIPAAPSKPATPAARTTAPVSQPAAAPAPPPPAPKPSASKPAPPKPAPRPAPPAKAPAGGGMPKWVIPAAVVLVIAVVAVILLLR